MSNGNIIPMCNGIVQCTNSDIPVGMTGDDRLTAVNFKLPFLMKEK